MVGSKERQKDRNVTPRRYKQGVEADNVGDKEAQITQRS